LLALEVVVLGSESWTGGLTGFLLSTVVGVLAVCFGGEICLFGEGAATWRGDLLDDVDRAGDGFGEPRIAAELESNGSDGGVP
jgi:hypothetical protein